jgi:heat shock protein HslJ
MIKYLIPCLAITIISISCSPKLSPDSGWGRQRWVLAELRGVPVQQSGGNRDAFIEFVPGEKRFMGNGGCNRLSGNYTLEKSEIRFAEVISTKMSCPDIAFETTFLSTLSEVNRYESNGTQLLLKDRNKVLLILQSR